MPSWMLYKTTDLLFGVFTNLSPLSFSFYLSPITNHFQRSFTNSIYIHTEKKYKPLIKYRQNLVKETQRDCFSFR